MEPEIRIRGYHTDMFQHVNNARYLEFLEEGRWQMLENHMDLEAFLQKGYMLFVVNINISYKNQARVNDIVVIKSGLGKIGNKSCVINQQVVNKTIGAVCAIADVTFVIADISGKPLKIEGELKEFIAQIPALKG
ncbi:MAG: acyl-CoA thioesterase [Desulfobacula sp.]|nr:acyl-CoA thioesterase [Desulfobacula sp.]